MHIPGCVYFSHGLKAATVMRGFAEFQAKNDLYAYDVEQIFEMRGWPWVLTYLLRPAVGSISGDLSGPAFHFAPKDRINPGFWDGPTLPSLRPKVWVRAGLGLGLREGRVDPSPETLVNSAGSFS